MAWVPALVEGVELAEWLLQIPIEAETVWSWVTWVTIGKGAEQSGAEYAGVKALSKLSGLVYDALVEPEVFYPGLQQRWDLGLGWYKEELPMPKRSNELPGVG